jgi:hypothetical protein
MYERSGLGWSNWRSSPGDPCDAMPNGQQRCFRTTTVDGQPPEQAFAAAQGCVRQGTQCSTTAGNPGLVWCCPPGWPIGPGGPPIEPGEQPPRPPLISPAMMRYLPWVVAAVGGAGAIWYWQKKKEEV